MKLSIFILLLLLRLSSTSAYRKCDVSSTTTRFIQITCAFISILTPQFTENVALRGTATQSHATDNIRGAALNAIDGNHDSHFLGSSCTHTQDETNPWWRVDLHESYIVTSVTVTNRGDCCHERLNGLEIHIGNSLNRDGLGNPKLVKIRTTRLLLTERVFSRVYMKAREDIVERKIRVWMWRGYN